MLDIVLILRKIGRQIEPMDRNKSIILIVGIVCAMVFGIALFIWPTPYTYQIVRKPIGGTSSIEQLYRVNRFTGKSSLVIDGFTGPEKEFSIH